MFEGSAVSHFNLHGHISIPKYIEKIYEYNTYIYNRKKEIIIIDHKIIIKVKQ